MKTYKVDYISLEDELCEGIVEAWTKEDAKIAVRKEYWDVKEIIKVREI